MRCREPPLVSVKVGIYHVIILRSPPLATRNEPTWSKIYSIIDPKPILSGPVIWCGIVAIPGGIWLEWRLSGIKGT
jgi:hypothetical protein